jgi:hypothetical protein
MVKTANPKVIVNYRAKPLRPSKEREAPVA